MSKLVRIVKEPVNFGEIYGFLGNPESGAHCVFSGVVRNNNDGKVVTGIIYHCYEEMALRELHNLADRILSEFRVSSVALVHRIGKLNIGEVSVIVAVSSAHRAASFDAARFGIEALKRDVPIWKEEFFDGGRRWVENQ